MTVAARMHFSELHLLNHLDYRDEHPVLVDAGAHHGGFSRTFAQRGWQVVAFEPGRENHAALMRNLAGYPAVTCIAKAVTDVTGQRLPFYVSDEHYGIHALMPFHRTHRMAYNVETIRLDDALTELQVPSVTLLKIDIEGADFLALKSFDFDGFRPEAVMVEFMDERSMPGYGYTHHDMAIHMQELGYVTFVSEWEPIKEYAREGATNDPHIWVQCAPYPLDHQPAWGNLLFFPESRTTDFERTLTAYLGEIQRLSRTKAVRSFLQAIPGARSLYHALCRGRLTPSGE
jgi:FkbM family methyltransferase